MRLAEEMHYKVVLQKQNLINSILKHQQETESKLIPTTKDQESFDAIRSYVSEAMSEAYQSQQAQLCMIGRQVAG